jgi:hypothetical protein
MNHLATNSEDLYYISICSEYLWTAAKGLAWIRLRGVYSRASATSQKVNFVHWLEKLTSSDLLQIFTLYYSAFASMLKNKIRSEFKASAVMLVERNIRGFLN